MAKIKKETKGSCVALIGVFVSFVGILVYPFSRTSSTGLFGAGVLSSIGIVSSGVWWLLLGDNVAAPASLITLLVTSIALYIFGILGLIVEAQLERSYEASVEVAPNEVVLWQGRAKVLESKTFRLFGGVSARFNGSLRLGGGTSVPVETEIPSDAGTLTVTTTRLIFREGQQEWAGFLVNLRRVQCDSRHLVLIAGKNLLKLRLRDAKRAAEVIRGAAAMQGRRV